MKEEKLKEFVNLNYCNKFIFNSKMKFSDNTSIGHWWRNNKNKILNSDDILCLIIKEQYEAYIRKNEEKKSKQQAHSYKLEKVRFNLYDEFEKIEDLDKFNKDTKIILSNGMNAYVWFVNQQKIIFGDKSHIGIIEQYKNKRKIDALKRKKEEQKKLLLNIKYGYLFLAIDDINKFDSYARYRFPDASSCPAWFIANKDKILNSNLEIFIKIKEQYNDYLLLLKLKEEFLESDFNKFESFSDVRFSTGAFMYDWFESNKDNILTSIYKLDIEISKQYKKYMLGNYEEKKRFI